MDLKSKSTVHINHSNIYHTIQSYKFKTITQRLHIIFINTISSMVQIFGSISFFQIKHHFLTIKINSFGAGYEYLSVWIVSSFSHIVICYLSST